MINRLHFFDIDRFHLWWNFCLQIVNHLFSGFLRCFEKIKTSQTDFMISVLLLSGFRLIRVTWRMLVHLHGALNCATTFMSQYTTATTGFSPGWTILLWEKAGDRNDSATSHQPPTESSTTHCYHFSRKQVQLHFNSIHSKFISISLQCLAALAWNAAYVCSVSVSDDPLDDGIVKKKIPTESMEIQPAVSIEK